MDRVNGRVITKQNVSGKVTTKQSISGKVSMPSGGAKDYNLLSNKPSIEDISLIGNRTMSDFGDRHLSNLEIQSIVDSVFNS